MSDHNRAIKIATRTNKGIRALFNKMGNQEHPRGMILTAYRQARGALAAHFEDQAAAQGVLFNLKRDVDRHCGELLDLASILGLEAAKDSLGVYKIDPAFVSQALVVSTAKRAVGGVVDQQVNRALGLMAQGSPDARAMILGQGLRLGLLQPAPVNSQLANQITGAVFALWGQVVTKSADPGEFHKQVVAAIDQKTTQTCLKAHAQSVPFSKKFNLKGTPRFADKMNWVPFHWY